MESRRRFFRLAALAALAGFMAPWPFHRSRAGGRDAGVGERLEVVDGWVLRRDDRQDQGGSQPR